MKNHLYERDHALRESERWLTQGRAHTHRHTYKEDPMERLQGTQTRIAIPRYQGDNNSYDQTVQFYTDWL